MQAVAAMVFEIGLRQSSPKIIKELLNASDGERATTEHIKSHLQKARMHIDRSRKDFIAHYVERLKLPPPAADDEAAAARSAAAAAAAPQPPPPPPPPRRKRKDEGRDLAQLLHTEGVQDKLGDGLLALQEEIRAALDEHNALFEELSALHRDPRPAPGASDAHP